VIRDSAGNLYGTTWKGGKNTRGVVYKVNTLGVETVLYSFGESGEGFTYAGVVGDREGNLYGTTPGENGGISGGTVYKLDASGNLTFLYTFEPAGSPAAGAGVILDPAGNLYGTILNPSSVYKVDTAGQETVLGSFPVPIDGGLPQAGVVRGMLGDLYGTTTLGGTYGQGVVYKLDVTGKETVLSDSRAGPMGEPPSDAVWRLEISRVSQRNLLEIAIGDNNLLNRIRQKSSNSFQSALRRMRA
jgi:uncharacterized repeat protein (TIGR03803 family)